MGRVCTQPARTIDRDGLAVQDPGMATGWREVRRRLVRLCRVGV